MIFHVKHVTKYVYSRPVFCEPIRVRLRPREDGSQRLSYYRLTVDPVPAGVSEFLDADGHVTTLVWFSRLASCLSVTTGCVVETLRPNPFDYLLDLGADRLPLEYSPQLAATLAPYRQPGTASPRIAELARSLSHAADGTTVAFLSQATNWIYGSLEKVIRPHGPPQAAETTLAQAAGSCRDLAVLFNEICRAAGLAARFVSGYFSADPDQPEHQLHAWSEVYLPGGGWRGYDPMHGLAVADQHIALAAALEPAAAAPTSGSFRGTGATSTIDTQIVLRIAEPQSVATPECASLQQSQSR